VSCGRTGGSTRASYRPASPAYYRQEAGAGVARRFPNEFERVAKLFEEFPGTGTLTAAGRRSFPLVDFPYSVIYRAEEAAPAAIQAKAQSAYRLWSENPAHPSLRFKQVHGTLPIYAARIDLDWRALGVMKEGAVVWFLDWSAQ
jgi:hypothetical protein